MTAAEPVENGKITFGVRVYAENRKLDERMAPHRLVVAIATLFIYTAWPYILFILLLFSWYPPVLLLNLALFSTVLMPAKLFWPEFLNLGVFNTWREYFSFSYKFEGVRKRGGIGKPRDGWEERERKRDGPCTEFGALCCWSLAAGSG